MLVEDFGEGVTLRLFLWALGHTFMILHTKRIITLDLMRVLLYHILVQVLQHSAISFQFLLTLRLILEQLWIAWPHQVHPFGCLESEVVLWDGEEYGSSDHHDDFEDTAKVPKKVYKAVHLPLVLLFQAAHENVDPHKQIGVVFIPLLIPVNEFGGVEVFIVVCGVARHIKPRVDGFDFDLIDQSIF